MAGSGRAVPKIGTAPNSQPLQARVKYTLALYQQNFDCIVVVINIANARSDLAKTLNKGPKEINHFRCLIDNSWRDCH